MVNAFTTRVGLIQPEVGQNLNTWGTLLNDNAMALIDKGLGGFENIPVTGDFSLTRTNGDATSTQINKGIRLAGTPTADFTVLALAYEHITLYANVSGRTATIKVSAGTGVTLATGQIAYLGYNSALGDVTNVTPNVIAGACTIGGALTVAGKISGVTPGTAGTDAVNLNQMAAAISVLAGVIAGGLVLTSPTDLAAKYLSSALTAAATSGITLTVTSSGTVNEYLAATLNISGLTASAIAPVSTDLLPGYFASANKSMTMALFMQYADILADHGARTDIASGTTAMTANRRYRITGTATATLPTYTAGQWNVVEYGAATGLTQTVGRNSQTINGNAADNTCATKGPIILYYCTSAGVVVSKLIGRVPV